MLVRWSLTLLVFCDVSVVLLKASKLSEVRVVVRGDLEYSASLAKVQGYMKAYCTGSLLYRFIWQHSAEVSPITVWNKIDFIFLQRNMEISWKTLQNS
jgi:hypothetical protein